MAHSVNFASQKGNSHNRVKTQLKTRYLLKLFVPFLLLFHSNFSYAEGIKVLSEKWLSAIETNRMDTAISIARHLVPITSETNVPERHIKIAQREGIKATFFKSPFNFWDFQLWRHSYFFRQLSEKITNNDPNNIEALFDAVRKRIESNEGKSQRAPWPYWIWQRGFGVCDRQAWVLCELAYQQGWETQIVYLRDPKTKVSPHTICELRRSGTEVWFADPHANILFKNTSISAVVSNNKILYSMWDKHPELREAVKDSVFWTPSYPQDYCPRNQELQKVLKQHLGDRCPKFGVPPGERLESYKGLIQKTIFDKPRFPMQLWFYPFRLLREDIIRYINQFGVNFLK
jgi:hypothetical protein